MVSDDCIRDKNAPPVDWTPLPPLPPDFEGDPDPGADTSMCCKDCAHECDEAGEEANSTDIGDVENIEDESDSCHSPESEYTDSDLSDESETDVSDFEEEYLKQESIYLTQEDLDNYRSTLDPAVHDGICYPLPQDVVPVSKELARDPPYRFGFGKHYFFTKETFDTVLLWRDDVLVLELSCKSFQYNYQFYSCVECISPGKVSNKYPTKHRERRRYYRWFPFKFYSAVQNKLCGILPFVPFDLVSRMVDVWDRIHLWFFMRITGTLRIMFIEDHVY